MYQVYTLSSSFKPEDIRYIGITRVGLKRRLSNHLFESKRSNKPSFLCKNTWVMSVINSGGCIIISEIDNCESIEEASQKEIFYIKQYRDNGSQLVNLTSGGQGYFENNYFAIARGEKLKNKACKYNLQQICPLKLIVISVYNGIYNAERITGIKGKSIQASLRRKSGYCGGFFWAKTDKNGTDNFFISNEDAERIKKYQTIKFINKELSNRHKKSKTVRCKKSWLHNTRFNGYVYKIDIKSQMVIEVFDSILSASMKHSEKSNKVWDCVVGKNSTAYGYGWIQSFKEPTKKEVEDCCKRALNISKNRIFNMNKMKKYMKAS